MKDVVAELSHFTILVIVVGVIAEVTSISKLDCALQVGSAIFRTSIKIVVVALSNKVGSKISFVYVLSVK